MPRNVEIKARVPDLTPVRDRLRALGAGEPEHLQQRDTYFRSQTGRYKLREHVGGSAELIHYQRSDLDEPALSSYTLVPTQTPGSVRRSFTSLLGVRGEVVKRREVYHLDRTRVHLDLVEGLGTFVELEVVLAPGEAAAVGGAEVYRVLDVLGLVEAELIAASYIDLVEAKGPSSPKSGWTG